MRCGRCKSWCKWGSYQGTPSGAGSGDSTVHGGLAFLRATANKLARYFALGWRQTAGLRQTCSPSAVNRGDVRGSFGDGSFSDAQPQDGPADFHRGGDLQILPKVSLHGDLDGGRRAGGAPLAEKVTSERGVHEICTEASVFQGLKADSLQGVLVPAIWSVAGAAVLSPDPRQSTLDDASQFSAEFGGAPFPQPLLRFFGGKPGGISIRFLRRFEPSHFAKVRTHGKLWLSRSGIRTPVFFAIAVSALRRK